MATEESGRIKRPEPAEEVVETDEERAAREAREAEEAAQKEQEEALKRTGLTYGELYNTLSQYTPRTPEDINARAAAMLDSQYANARLAAQQQADRNVLAVQNQLDALGTSYDRNIQDLAEQFRQTLSQADRNALRKGMQRSSYAAATRANIGIKGAEAAGQVLENRTNQENALNAQIAQYQQQLADQLGQMDRNYQTDLQAKINELEDQDYQRQQAQNELLLNLYQLGDKQNRGAGVNGGSGGMHGSGYTAEEIAALQGQTPTTTKKPSNRKPTPTPTPTPAADATNAVQDALANSGASLMEAYAAIGITPAALSGKHGTGTGMSTAASALLQNAHKYGSQYGNTHSLRMGHTALNPYQQQMLDQELINYLNKH